MKKRRTTLFLVLSFVLCLMLSACGSATSDTQASDAQGKSLGDRVLRDRALADAPTYDPFKTNDVETMLVHYQIFESCFFEAQDGSYQPAICESYEFNEAGDVLTMKIREGVKFHNGSVVTPEDVAFSLNTAINSAYTAKVTSAMDYAEVVDGNVVLHLKFPYASAIGCLVSSNCAIVPKDVYEADPDAFAHNPVGAGAYTLGEIKAGEAITLNAFPDYWRGEAPIKTVVKLIIPDNTSARMALEAGELDMMEPASDYTDYEQLNNNPNVTYYKKPAAVFYCIGFNCDNGIFTDQRIRMAIAHAIDKEDLILGALNGMATPTDAAMVMMNPQYPEEFEATTYDLDLAKQLLAEAGYPNGFSCTMRIIGAPNYTKPAEVIQNQLKKIGIEMKIEPMERASWFEQCYTGGNYEITYYAHPISVNDADFAMYPYFHSSGAGGGTNFYQYKSAELDALLEAARASTNENERKDLYKKAAEHVRDEAVSIPTSTGWRCMVAVNELNGVYADPMIRYYLYNYSWKE